MPVRGTRGWMRRVGSAMIAGEPERRSDVSDGEGHMAIPVLAVIDNDAWAYYKPSRSG